MSENKNASPPMKVLMLSPNPGVCGGVTTFVTTMTSHFTQSEVMRISTGSPDKVPGARKKESFFRAMQRMLLNPIEIARRMRREKFDVVHLNPDMEEKSLLSYGLILFALRMTGCRRVLIYFHGWRPPLVRRIGMTFIFRRLLVWMLNGAARITVLSPEFKESLEEMGVDGRRISVTRPMFDGEALKAATAKPQPRNARRTILFMSRFTREKGVYELLDAFGRLAREYPDVDLVFAGDGEEDEKLRAAAAALHVHERISFTGLVSGEEKWRLLAECSVFALPTYASEGIPVALIEAMAAGKPVLTTDAGGIGYVVSDPENGVVLTEVTGGEVSGGLGRLLRHKDYSSEVGARNKQAAWLAFEATSVTAEIEAMYREIAGA